MDRDIESKIERLCVRYLEAQAEIITVQPVNAVPTGRALRQASVHVVDALSDLKTKRKGAAASLIKLAYVRGMREVNPQARLGQAQLREVKFLERRLDLELRRLEKAAFISFRSNLRRLRLVETLESNDYPRTTIDAFSGERRHFPLEQHARASIRTIVDMAANAGASATHGDTH